MTNWGLDETGERNASLAAHRGEQYLKDCGKREPPVVPGETREGTEWIREALSNKRTLVVLSQPEDEAAEPLIVVPTPLTHQDAGTVILDKELRKELRKETEKGKKPRRSERIKNTGQDKGITFERPKIPTKPRKRSRTETPSLERTASQDSCTQRNPFRPSEGYTPGIPKRTDIAQPQTETRTETQSDEIAFLKLVLAKTDHAIHGTAAKRIVTGIYDFLAQKVLGLDNKGKAGRTTGTATQKDNSRTLN